MQVSIWHSAVMNIILTRHDIQDVAPGAIRRGPNDKDLRVLLRAEWAALSKEEQKTVTKDRFQQLTDNRKIRRVGKHIEEETAFHDAQATLTRIENEVNDML